MVNRWSQGAPYGTTAIPYIGENGNWWVNQEDTGVKAQGPQGQQGQRGEAGIGAPGPALMYEDMTEEQKLELASHYTDDMQAIKDSCIAETNALIATAKTEMDATKAAALEEAATIAKGTTTGIVNEAVENAQAEIDATVATATTNINAAAANAENSKIAAQEAANSATVTLESMQNIKQEAITAAQNAAAETATSTVNTLVEQAQADIDANITEAKNVATAAATNADASKVEANTSANSAASSATAAANSATEANAAKVAAEAAANSVTLDADAMNAAVQASKSYAVGGTGTREGEDADNSKYYYGLCKTLASSGGSSYMGECAYADLPADATVGAVYKITDEVDLMTEEDYNTAGLLMASGKMDEAQLLMYSKHVNKGDLLICTGAGVWEIFARDLLVLVSSMSLSMQDLARKCDADTLLDPKSSVDLGNILAGSYIAEPITLGTCVVSWDGSGAVPCTGRFNIIKPSVTEEELAAGGYYEFTVATCNVEGYYTLSLFFDNDNNDDNTSVSIINHDSGDVLLENIGQTTFSNPDDTLPNFSVRNVTTIDVVLKVPKSAVLSNPIKHIIKLYQATVTPDRFNTINDMTVSAWKATKTALTTLEEVDAVMESGNLVDAMAVKELDGKIAYGNAGSHNSIYRGKYLGDTVTDAQYAAIAAGTFDDLFIGDYWTIGGVNYRIAAFDYYLKCGNPACTKHHAVIVPDTKFYDYAMNDTAITTGGYVGSKMYTKGLEQAKTTIKAAFSGHVLSHKIYLTNAVANGKPSAGAWCDSEVDLMCEEMVYGGGIFRPTSDGSTIPANYRVEKSQLPLFAYRPDLISNRVYYWLRDVVTATYFAVVLNYGGANAYAANYCNGVRPAFCIS